MRQRINSVGLDELNSQTSHGFKPNSIPKDEDFLMIMDWNNKKLKLQERYPQLSDDDLVYDEGNLRALLNRIQIKLGKTRYEVKKIIEELK